MRPDRNFDELAERFGRRIYGGLKGAIRLAVLWRDLEEVLVKHSDSSSVMQIPKLEILDIGCGLAQIARRLAGQGHSVLCNDISAALLEQAQDQVASESNSGSGTADAGQLRWRHGPYQDLLPSTQQFPLILSHALIEWLEHPRQMIADCHTLLEPGGVLSLCFYNCWARDYRNLVRGNFDWLDREEDYLPDSGSLTPDFHHSPDAVMAWLDEEGFEVQGVTGVRVFHDYVVEKRGGHTDNSAVIAKELEYSTRFPYIWLGRYLHVVAIKRMT